MAVARLLRRLLLTLVFVTSEVLLASVGGNISGTVVDPGNLPVAHAIVTAVNRSTGIRLTAATDSQGLYSLQDLAIGSYDIEVTGNGFQTYRQTQVTVDANSSVRVDAALVIGPRNEEVQVHAT